MTSTTTIALKPIILTLVEKIIEGTLTQVVNVVNNLVKQILG